MKIVDVQDLHADGGYRNCHYLKVTTDEGIVGWSEYYDEFSGGRIAPLIHQFAAKAKTEALDPTDFGWFSSALTATTRLASGGLATQAIAALENACLDIAGKAAGVPVYKLLGGAFRTRLPLYWTHCGSYRVRFRKFYEEELGTQPIRKVEDFKTMGEEAVARGFRAVKTNPVLFRGEFPQMFNGGFRIGPGVIERNPDSFLISAIIDQLSALREGIGPDRGLMLDVSFSHRSEGYIRMARALEPLDLLLLELDTHDSDALRLVRECTRTPISSMEGLYGVQGYRPFLEKRAADVAIVDVMWNGVYQSSRIATIADAYDINVAPHNPVGDLGNLMSAHFCAALPNFRIMEYRADEAPWTHDYLTHKVEIEDGEMIVPNRPGWGADIIEEQIAARPPRHL